MGVLLCPWEFKTQHARQWWWSVNVQRWLKAHDFQREPEILSYNINIKYHPRTSQCHSSSVVSKALWGNSVMTPETRLKDDQNFRFYTTVETFVLLVDKP